MKPILHQELAYFWNPYNATEARTLTFATSPSTSNVPPSREFGQTESYFVHEELHPSEIPALWRIPLAELPTGAAGVWGGYDHREFSSIKDPRRPCTSHKMVTFHPIRPCDLPIWNLAHSRCVDRLTPNDYPVARAGDADQEYYGMMMGGLPNTPEKKLAALSILSKLSNESIGLVGVHRFPDGFIQTHTGGHLAFFYVQGAAAAANVMEWSKCLLVCEDEVVVVLNSLGEPEQAEKILRTIVPKHEDGTPFRRMGHPCPIEFKANAPERRQPAVAQAKSVAVPAQAPRRPMAPAPVQFAPRQYGQRKGKQ